MSAWEIGGGVAGGIGLFLLGMSMMTDGLKLAAGPALQHILAGATRTHGHALGSGILVTALVQSSSAVTGGHHRFCQRRSAGTGTGAMGDVWGQCRHHHDQLDRRIGRAEFQCRSTRLGWWASA